MKKQVWRNFDHQIWHLIKEFGLEHSHFVIGFSGGIDSIAVAHALGKILKPEQISLAHFHHGGRALYREKALMFCRAWAEARGLSFVSKKWQGKTLKSEAEFRQGRYEFLRSLISDAILVTGHHADDLMETRLLRLIRGTGPQGMNAMKSYSEGCFRPLLLISKDEIEMYVNKENLKFLTDPSNKDTDFLRNWIRNVWLPMLERKRRGSTKSLARSLRTLAESFEGIQSRGGNSLPRGEFLSMSFGQQRQVLAQQMLSLGLKDFTQFHINEIRRRLLDAPKQHQFRVAGALWTINAQQIAVEKTTQELV